MQTSSSYRVCIPLEGSAVEQCNQAVALANDGNITFSCVAGGSAAACMQMIADGKAELTKFGASDIYLANRDYGLEPLASEYLGGDVGTEYYSVAIVNTEWCNPDRKLSDLKVWSR
jgi:Transferrin